MAEFNQTTSRRKNIKPMIFDLDIDSSVPIPSLVLLINPTSLEIKYSPKIVEQRTRWSYSNIPYIFHAHHDELDILSCAGKSAMFVSDKGITRVDRIKTLAYENIETLIAMYKNNGTKRNSKPNNIKNPATIMSVGRVSISYDNFIYKGHFINLTLSENDTSPFNIDFTFEFRISKTFDSFQYNSDYFSSGQDYVSYNFQKKF